LSNLVEYLKEKTKFLTLKKEKFNIAHEKSIKATDARNESMIDPEDLDIGDRASVRSTCC